MTIFRKLAVACAVSALSMNAVLAQSAPAAPSAATTFKPSSGQEGKDVVWVPTPQALVDRMLDMAAVTKDDYLIDLGSGDGRTVITAAKRGTRAHGIEYNPDMVALSQRNAESENLSGRATFEQADIFQSDFSKASVITLFLLPQLNVRLRPTLLDMKPGTRIVSNSFDMDDWQPDDRVEAQTNCTSYCRAFKWVVPAKVEGKWRLGEGELTLNQTYQMLAGTLAQGGRSLPISDARMNGGEIAFTIDGRRYTGRAVDGTMSGLIDGGAIWSASRSTT